MIAHLAMLITKCLENTLSTFMKLPALINEVDKSVKRSAMIAKTTVK